MKIKHIIILCCFYLILLSQCYEEEHAMLEPELSAQLELKLVDADSNALKNVGVKIYDNYEDWNNKVNVIDSGSTNNLGIILFENLRNQEYYFSAYGLVGRTYYSNDSNNIKINVDIPLPPNSSIAQFKIVAKEKKTVQLSKFTSSVTIKKVVIGNIFGYLSMNPFLDNGHSDYNNDLDYGDCLNVVLEDTTSGEADPVVLITEADNYFKPLKILLNEEYIDADPNFYPFEFNLDYLIEVPSDLVLVIADKEFINPDAFIPDENCLNEWNQLKDDLTTYGWYQIILKIPFSILIPNIIPDQSSPQEVIFSHPKWPKDFTIKIYLEW